MTDNVISFEEKRLEHLGGTVFGSTQDELAISAVGSQIEFARTELKLVQDYIDLAYAGTISITMNDGSEPPLQPFAHLGNVLANYEQMLFDNIAALESQLEMLNSPSGEDEH